MTTMDDFLPMIGEEESFEIVEGPQTSKKTVDKDVAEAHLDKAKAKTAVLAVQLIVRRCSSPRTCY